MIAIYAAKNRDEAVRESSSSGGIFMALCVSTIDKGGAVYGVRYDADMRVVHGRAVSIDECRRFSGSKYVQSDLGTCLLQVREDLRAGRPVLFSGTPCQVAGLRSFLALSRTTGDLLTVEVICNGVPSPKLWEQHVALIEDRIGARVVDFVFRDKTVGWRGVHCRAVTDRGDVRDRLVGAYGEISARAFRSSCHECPFANLHRSADLTIGDYWGVEKHFPEFDDDMGVSLVLVNTETGRLAFGAMQGELDSFAVSVDECIQPNLKQPRPPSRHRAAFWRRYRRVGYEKAIKYYTSYGLVRRWLRKSRKSLREFIR